MKSQTFKLGKLPARKDAVTFKLANYIDKTVLPKPPKSFGHESVGGWQMFGNDRYGDCVWAGAAEETRVWNAEAGRAVVFSDKSVLSDYSAATGFNPNDPSTDQGTDMQAAASYRRKTGILDATGKRHKVDAYLAITPGDIEEHMLAAWLFGAVGIGIEFPSYAMDLFNQGRAWTYRSKHSIEGGHYSPLCARRKGRFVCVTWGKEQSMSDAFFRHFNDESVAYVSLEMLKGGISLEGFNSQQLLADLQALEASK